jgi:putative outer membrane protein
LKAKLLAGAAQAEGGAKVMTEKQGQVKDKYLECTQRGWGVTPIIGLDFKTGRWNFGTRLELNTHLNIENDTKVDDTGLFQHGVNTPSDLPGLWTIGTQYAILPNLRAMASYHLYFDKSAKMANDKQKLLGGNTQEFLAGMEWDITPDITVSAGGQRTQYNLGDGAYLSDMSFVTSSYSIGFGAQVRLAKNMKLNVAYFWTNYENFDKTYKQTVVTNANPLATVTLDNTDRFSRTNKVLGVGLDIVF